MQSTPMDADLLLAACNLYQTSPELLTPLSGGFYNAVYKFPFGNSYAILRIGKEDCPPEQTLGMLEWVRYLSREGAPVSAPVPSIRNRLVENLAQYGTRYTMTAFEEARGLLAERIPVAEWTDDLFASLGTAVGKLHRISRMYKPSRASRTRPQWFDSYEIQEASRILEATDDPARGQLGKLISDLKALPTDPTDYGLIHDDLHFANFLIQPDGQVTIIDFDDCSYGWFAMDVAMALFDVLVLYGAKEEADSRRFAERFLTAYLQGYCTENELSPFWLNQIPHFLKLKELCIYSALLNHPDIDKPETWVGRFMRDRTARIANDLPYVDLDFSNWV